MWYVGFIMSRDLPKISMFRSWGRLQAHTHITSHHSHQYIRTLYRASPENLQHGDTTHWLLASRESGDLLAQRELLLSHLRSRRCNGRCGTSSRLEAMTAGGCDCNSLTSCQYDETKFHIESLAVDISTRPIFVINISRPRNCHEHYCDMSCI